VSTELVLRAEEWIAPFRDAHHLRRARDWLLELEPDASEALVLAALTHDMERHFPGGPQTDPRRYEPGDPEYNTAHQERSATIVSGWLLEQGASPELAEHVAHLIRRHELGGDEEQNLLQAADSLSFLETKIELMIAWLREDMCGPERAHAQPRWMLDRIQIERARELARPLYELAAAELDAEIARLAEAPS
jgi:hypothetical protein